MKNMLLITLTLTLLIAVALPVQAEPVGRDILLVEFFLNDWTGRVEVIAWQADGTRTLFDLTTLRGELYEDEVDLLEVLQTHGLLEETEWKDVPAPEAMAPVSQEAADKMRDLISQVQDEPFITEFFAFDAGTYFVAVVLQAEGRPQLVKLLVSGTMEGRTEDPGGLQVLDLLFELVKDEDRVRVIGSAPEAAK